MIKKHRVQMHMTFNWDEYKQIVELANIEKRSIPEMIRKMLNIYMEELQRGEKQATTYSDNIIGGN